MAEHLPRKGAEGFDGEITGLGLSDVIQLNVLNRFSGCIDVQFEGRRGLIFLKDGEIVHAEQGGVTGDIAFYEILSWPGGRFGIQENVATTRSTIKKSWQFLILEAHRLMDERRAGHPAEPAPPARPATPARKPTPASLVAAVRAIPGVASAVLQGKEGGRTGDDGYEGEVLAGQALFVAMVAKRLSDGLRAGDVHSAVVHGTTRHLLVFMSRNHLMTVAVAAGADVGVVEAEVRRALSPGR